jgi:hypothetical protein
MGRIRSFVGRHRTATVVAVAVAMAATVFAVAWFEPHKLFVDDRVDEAVPTAAPSATGPAEPSATTEATPPDATTSAPAEEPGPTEEPRPAGPTTLAEGDFRPLEHGAEGSARILRLEDGSLFLRFEDLNVSNGPDLRVYLTDQPLSDDWHVWDDGAFLDLGDLKGNIGDQNYLLDPDTNLSRWKTVVIWCRRFEVGFAVAPLSPNA